jgi:hypothetical protein
VFPVLCSVAGKTRSRCQVRDGPAFDQAERGAIAEEDVAEREVSATVGVAGLRDLRGIARIGETSQRQRRGGERRVQVVGEAMRTSTLDFCRTL